MTKPMRLEKKYIRSYYKHIKIKTFCLELRNPIKKTFYIQIGRYKLPIIVTYPVRNANYCRYYFSKRIEINVREPWNQQVFFDALFHEITHAMDDILYVGKKNNDFDGDYITDNDMGRCERNGNRRICTKINGVGKKNVNNILYHLWDASERSAYQTISLLGETYVNNFIADLSRQIQTLKKLNLQNLYGEHYYIKKNLNVHYEQIRHLMQ